MTTAQLYEALTWWLGISAFCCFAFALLLVHDTRNYELLLLGDGGDQ